MTDERYGLFGDKIDKDEKSRYSLFKRPFNPCKPFDGTVTVYNVLKYKSQDKRIFDRNHFIDNGFGQNIQLMAIGNPTKTFSSGDKITFKSKNYNVLADIPQGTTPETDPAKFSLFGQNDLTVTKQGVIQHYDQGTVLAPGGDSQDSWTEPDLVGRGMGFSTPDQGFQSVATFGNHHTKNSLILSNQRETSIFDAAIGLVQPSYTDGNNASDQTFDQADELKLPPFTYVFYDSTKDPVEMEFILLHTVIAPCRKGHLYLEIDKPDITETIDSTELSGNDHMVYFWGWEGNPDVNILTGEQFESNILNQLRQNQQTDIDDKIWAVNDDLLITAGDDFDLDEDFVGNIRLLYCCRLSDIKSIPDTKKMVVGLNLESLKGDRTFFNLLIGMKAIDWTFVNKSKDSATGIGSSEEIYTTYTNPAVMPKITFTCDDLRIKLDELGSVKWDDTPLHPIEADSLRSGGDENLGFDKVFFTNRYGLYAVDANGNLTIPGLEAKFGLTDETIDSHISEGGNNLISLATFHNKFKGFANITPSRELNFGNTGHVGNFSVCGNIMSLGSFELKEAKEGQYILRMPQIIRLQKLSRNHDAAGEFISHSDLTGHFITLQRGDEFIRKGDQTFNSNGQIDMIKLRSNMTKLKEFTTENFYSTPKTSSGEVGALDAPIFPEPKKCDMHRYVNIDITQGQGIQVSGKFWLVNGKSGGGTEKDGYFNADLDQGATIPSGPFTTYFIKTWVRIFAKLQGGDFGETAIPFRVDLGVMLFNIPRTFDLEEDPTPRLKLGL